MRSFVLFFYFSILIPSEARPKAERSGELGWSKKNEQKKKEPLRRRRLRRRRRRPIWYPVKHFTFFFSNFHTYVPSFHSKKYLWSLLRTNSLQKTSWLNLLWEKKIFLKKNSKIFFEKKNKNIFFEKKIRIFFFKKIFLNFFFFFSKKCFLTLI